MWTEQFWLPKNITWKDFSELKQQGIWIPQLHHLAYVYPLAALLYVTRLFLERSVAQPIGRFMGIRASSKSKHGLSPLRKFSESFWRFVYYLSIFIYGFVTLQDKSWLSDTRNCWLNHPNHPLTNDIFCYYMIELAFYWSLIFSQFIDVKRKDFWQMFMHHIATILLLSFSYIVNFVRIGTLVLVIHDFGDFWLEIAKMANYARAPKICNAFFGIFALVWFVTRLGYYPYKVLYTTTFEELEILGMFPAFYIFNGLLILLQILHYFWFYFICQVAISAMKAGEVTKDERSDSEESEDEHTNDKSDGRKNK